MMEIQRGNLVLYLDERKIYGEKLLVPNSFSGDYSKDSKLEEMIGGLSGKLLDSTKGASRKFISLYKFDKKSEKAILHLYLLGGVIEDGCLQYGGEGEIQMRAYSIENINGKVSGSCIAFKSVKTPYALNGFDYKYGDEKSNNTFQYLDGRHFGLVI
ncbi:MAG: hypothetical protein ACP5N1_01235 [Candidatus Woesearchaeota archaeon]